MSEPLVTVGMVVHNGEEYLAEAIQSFLDQSFASFELVVFDNASTDRSPQIAAAFAQIDDRIRVVRHSTNIGALRNFMVAAEAAESRYFCWAAHDDRRHEQCLATLVKSLEAHPEADLAACESLELDPDGTPRGICQATTKLRTTIGLTARSRLRMYLRHSPCSPIYGLFRTVALQRALPILAANEQGGGASVFGGDLVFLAGFLRSHDMTFISQPLLMLRGGGESHRPDAFRGVRHLLQEIREFHRRLRAVTRLEGTWDRSVMLFARWRLMFRYLTWPPVVRLFEYQLHRAVPLLRRVRSVWLLHRGAFGRFRRRARQLPAESRVAIVGAGKHTRRHLDTIRAALGRHVRLVAIGDDRADRLESLADIPVVNPETLEAHSLDLIVISSDTYERTLYKRAQLAVRGRVPVWCIYDLSLETARSDAGLKALAAASVSSRKPVMASMES